MQRSIFSKAFCVGLPFLAWNASATTVLTLGTDAPVRVIDPSKLSAMMDFQISRGIHSTLFSGEEYWYKNENLAKSVSHDAATSTFHITLRDQLTFSDGNPLTAQEVVASLKVAIEKDSGDSTGILGCLSQNSMSFSEKDIDKTIVVSDKLKIEIRNNSCGMRLRDILAYEQFGIVSPASRGKDGLWAGYGSPVSGLFVPISAENDVVTLRINEHHHLVRETKAVSTRELVIRRVDRTTTNDILKTLDVVGVGDGAIFSQFRDMGYETRMTIPARVVFLAPSQEMNVKEKWVQEAMATLNAKIDRTKISLVATDPLSNATDSYFPRGFGCGGKPRKPATPLKGNQYNVAFAVASWMPRYLDLEGFPQALEQEMKRIGIGVVSYPADRITRVLKLDIHRLYLGHTPLASWLPIFDWFNIVPDPDKLMAQAIKKASPVPGLEPDQQALTSACQLFFQNNHIPIAHQMVGVAAKKKAFLKVFPKKGFNLDIIEFLSIGDFN